MMRTIPPVLLSGFRVFLLSGLLAGCATAPKPAPIGVSIDGPKFPRSQFNCGSRPVPPDPAGATGKTAALFENRLGSWGDGCQGQLESVGVALDSAGQVVDAKPAKGTKP